VTEEALASVRRAVQAGMGQRDMADLSRLAAGPDLDENTVL
jgi:hypothetical protein